MTASLNHYPFRTTLKLMPAKNRTQFLKIVFSPGVAPDKWFQRFDERTHGWRAAGAQADDPLRYIDSGAADIAIVRLSAVTGGVEEKYHHVRLYQEQIGVAAPKDHPIKVMDSIDYGELEGEMEMYRTPADGHVDIAAVREALGVVGANVGICLAPRPLLRAINARGVVHRDLHGAESIGDTRIALMWLKDRDSEEIQDFVGICRGRKENSGRQNLSKKITRRNR